MEELDKNRIIIILAILSLILFLTTVKSSLQATRLKNKLNQEMSVRFDLEEARLKIEQKQRSLEEALREEQASRQAAEKALLETKAELEKMTELKEALEEDLKEALVRNKKK